MPVVLYGRCAGWDMTRAREVGYSCLLDAGSSQLLLATGAQCELGTRDFFHSTASRSRMGLFDGLSSSGARRRLLPDASWFDVVERTKVSPMAKSKWPRFAVEVRVRKTTNLSSKDEVFSLSALQGWLTWLESFACGCQQRICGDRFAGSVSIHRSGSHAAHFAMRSNSGPIAAGLLDLFLDLNAIQVADG